MAIPRIATLVISRAAPYACKLVLKDKIYQLEKLLVPDISA